MIGRADSTNYYEILEVRQDAPQGEIYRAYQRAKTTYTADNPALYSMFSPEETRELLKLIEEAYSILSNAALRKNYDDNLLSSQNSIEKNLAAFIASGNAQQPAKSNYSPNTKADLTDSSKFQTLESTDDYVIKKKENSSQLPEGFGKTSLSTFKIDKAKEQEIINSEIFDGAFLKSIREYKCLTLERMSDATRISRTYLGAVEANDYRELPAPVFVRGFIVQMARLLNIDETRAANSYMQIYKNNKKS